MIDPLPTAVAIFLLIVLCVVWLARNPAKPRRVRYERKATIETVVYVAQIPEGVTDEVHYTVRG